MESRRVFFVAQMNFSSHLPEKSGFCPRSTWAQMVGSSMETLRGEGGRRLGFCSDHWIYFASQLVSGKLKICRDSLLSFTRKAFPDVGKDTGQIIATSHGCFWDPNLGSFLEGKWDPGYFREI